MDGTSVEVSFSQKLASWLLKYRGHFLLDEPTDHKGLLVAIYIAGADRPAFCR